MNFKFLPFIAKNDFPEAEMAIRASEFYVFMKSRRTIRDFSDKQVSADIINDCILTAGSAPSGANQQPWYFVVVRDHGIKSEIRAAAEAEERNFYEGRAGVTWLEAVEPLGTNKEKPFLETAPVLIAIFEQKYHIDEHGKQVKHYYAKESVGIATGMLITALHNAGLVTLTHTPSPMNFLSNILKRPAGEKPFLLLVAGYPAKDVVVPDIKKKSLEEICTEI
ncbi:MAG: nitroreductase family protein [Candidatus Marinimicrobia bacterium]|nr:nitroreductase family protein [Candidatus Neomarinimicrobiota bacterium]